MKKLLYLFLFLPLFAVNGQKIGEFSGEKPHIDFPNNAMGMNLMIGEGGFGLGGFYSHSYSNTLTGFVDFTISEFKHEREVERFDIFGYPLPIFGKKNRVFILPVNLGVKYRLFYDSLTDNLRPFLAFGAGPSLIVTTPAQQEFFKSFGDAKAEIALGGYIGFGANFGTSSNNLTGISLRYFVVHLFNDGVEQYFGEFKTTLQQVALTINIGFMY